jgi:carbamoyltransferase
MLKSGPINWARYNTFFNENEPVVCKPEEALDCFLRTQMDVLVIGSWMVRRETSHE